MNELDNSWHPEKMLEVQLKEPDDFLKVRETLTRIGVASRKEKKLLIRGIKSEPLKSMHRRYAETFEALNIKINIDDFSYYKKIKITNHNYAFSSNDKLIGIAPFARHQCKEYSIDNIINFIDSLDKSW